ncbi:FG-GAP-like repeat-containing protein [Streptomyces boninensis]|uniref:FG-GAP-like repeat-containing protein n=1 Tax=Streptomyces boninensis TaxID=2039455 RepID=UPI003B21C520
MRTKSAVIAAACIAGAVAAGLTTPAAQAAPTTKLHEDFNGDGYADLATSAPYAGFGGKTKAGYIVIVYGSAKGLNPATRTVISKNTAGVPGDAADSDYFGTRLAARDLDGDNITDLAVVGNNDVTLLWGRKGGLTGEQAATLAGPAGTSGKVTGETLTAGDFNGDGETDLFATHSDDWEQRAILSGPFTRAGVPASEQQVDMFTTDNAIDQVVAGDYTGDGIDDLATFYTYENHNEGGRLWRGTDKGLSTDPTALPSAATATTGDFDKDGKKDLAIRTVPGDVNEDLPADPGTIKILYGDAKGPGATRTKTFTQNTAGVPGASEKGDQFGARLSAGDVNGDGYDDLAVGVPGEAIGTKAHAGAVVTLRGGSGGLTGTGAKATHQDTAGVPGVAEAGDQFGGAVKVLDANNDGKAEVAASAPQENATGAVWSLPATAFNPGDLGTPAKDARFGYGFAGEAGFYLSTQ